MQYFDTLPKIIQSDNVGISRIFTNLMSRVSIIPEILKNPMVYYNYSIQDSDTPEIVAHKYYGDSYRYWAVLFANKMLDPQWDWPMSGKVFDDYIDSKYGQNEAQSTVHHYEKILTQFDYGTNTETVNKVQIDLFTYNNLVEQKVLLTLPTGIVSVDITKKAVTLYEYEQDLNESKRNINILNAAYINELEKQFEELMNT
jgi:hypothetical protein